MGLIGTMYKDSNVFSRGVLIDRGACCSFKNMICLSGDETLHLPMVVSMHQRETPVPIPNTEVKPLVVNDTGAKGSGKVD